jgi:hypothetical protein
LPAGVKKMENKKPEKITIVHLGPETDIEKLNVDEETKEVLKRIQKKLPCMGPC